MQFFSSDFKLGILGGGQLGKMLLYDAKRYDLHTKVMDSNKDAPCNKIADDFIIGDITDYDDVINFGNSVDLITVEIENVNTDALEFLEILMHLYLHCLLYTSPSPRDGLLSRMPSSA